ncbi:hypothetical protein K456DRAFT_1764567 [Colletotrichum gloeosporioides 23]|nr:hypothetical protein K456DRAFT_1764567 [Colletotrichum gloeosporioides 23]
MTSVQAVRMVALEEDPPGCLPIAPAPRQKDTDARAALPGLAGTHSSDWVPRGLMHRPDDAHTSFFSQQFAKTPDFVIFVAVALAIARFHRTSHHQGPNHHKHCASKSRAETGQWIYSYHHSPIQEGSLNRCRDSEVLDERNFTASLQLHPVWHDEKKTRNRMTGTRFSSSRLGRFVAIPSKSTVFCVRAGIWRVPGPFLAALSNLYRVYNVSKGNNQASLIALHDELGDNVRLGPRVVSIRNAADIAKVYSVKNGFPKSGFYAVQQQLYWSTGFSFRMVQFYAFDVITELTCGRPFGFMRQGCDLEGIITALNIAMDYNAIVGQVPWLDRWLKKNPIICRFSRSTEQNQKPHERQINGQSLDFVHKFFRAKEAHPDIVNDGQVLSYMITNIFAGSDTTAISLRAILYYTTRSPQVYSKLMAELDEACDEGRLSVPVSWKQSQQLTYLTATVSEALRLHPAVGLILERIVPEEGLELADGTHLPGGIIVGASPWVVHHDKEVFGDDVNVFRPERWLQDENESQEEFDKRFKTMAAATFTFGKGHRTCIGKSISLLEIFKMIPSFFLTFEVCIICENP